MRRSCVVGAVLCALLLVGGAVQARTDSFTAILNGANVVGGGDPVATGLALISIDREVNHMDVKISFQGLGNGSDTLAAAHIRKGVAGTNGPGVFTMAVSGFTGKGYFQVGFTNFPAAMLITEATAHNYYVNLSSELFPSGAIRGQLVPVVVPEPETLALMLAGAGVVGWSMRRQPGHLHHQLR